MKRQELGTRRNLPTPTDRRKQSDRFDHAGLMQCQGTCSGMRHCHADIPVEDKSDGQEPWRRRRAKRSSEPRNIAQRKSEQWPLTRPAQQLRRPPESCWRRQRMPSKRAARKSRNPHPASKRRLDAPQSVRLAGAVAQPADANAPQDGQPLAERRLEKKRRRNAGQNAGRGSFMPQTAARSLPIFGTKTHDVSIRRA